MSKWKTEYGQRWRLKNKEHIRKYNQLYRETHDETSRHREYSRQLRIKVLTHYCDNQKPNCACCGETNIEFMCIDHINGGGEQHRKALGGNGGAVALWLKRNNFPLGFRVLCHNCNSSIGYYGYCPHDRKKNET